MEDTLSGYLSGLYEEGGQRLGRSLALWRDGIRSEIGFWDNWFATQGDQWPDNYADRIQPRPVESWVQELLPHGGVEGGPYRVLDIGAGPVTNLGTYFPGGNAKLLPMDPLARHYRKLIRENRLDVPLHTEFGFAEDLSCRLEASSIDAVSCQNALDHSIEPMLGIIEMLVVLKNDATAILAHRENEAENAKYDGLHQWNLSHDGDEFVIWNKARRLNVSRILAHAATVEVRPENDTITVLIRKHRDLGIDMREYQRKMRAMLLDALVMSAA